jgi:hypothetical protein
MLSGGINYAALDIIDIDNGGLGTGAQITVDSVDGFGTILTFTLTAGGLDYVGPVFTFTTIGSGVGADFSFVEGVDFDSAGAILTFTITNGGLYDIVPTVTIPVSNDGGGLDAIPLIADCPAFLSVGEDCDDIPFSVIGLPHAEVFAVCTNALGITGVAPVEFTITEIGCCIPEDTVDIPVCVDYHIDNTTLATVTIDYTGCNGIMSSAIVAAGTTVAVCAIIDGVFDPGVSGIDITTSLAPCA